MTTREIDKTRVNNWKNRLSTQKEKMQILFEEECTRDQAIEAWQTFFNHDYWSSFLNKNINEICYEKRSVAYSDTEEFIEDMYDIDEKYDVLIDCRVMGNGFTLMPIVEFLDKYAIRFGKFIPHNFSVRAKVSYTTAPTYDKVLWKVRNVGEEAEKRNDIRGQILDRGTEITENTLFAGQHYIECYLIKNNVCVGIGHVKVPIGIK